MRISLPKYKSVTWEFILQYHFNSQIHYESLKLDAPLLY